MATQTEINNISYRIRAAAIVGTDKNPKGVPALLADLMVAQAKHETGNFTSRAFLQDNNAFGYSFVPGGYWQLGPGLIADNGKPVARYATIEDSTAEIVDWIYRRISEGKFPANLNDITTPDQYAQLLKGAGYYGDTLQNYLEGLRRWFVLNTGSDALLILGLALALYAARKQLKKLLGAKKL